MVKNVNILGVHWKIWLLGGFMKNQNRGGALNSLLIYKGGLARKKEVVFLRGGVVDSPMRTMRVVKNLRRNLFFVSKMTRIWWILIWALKSLKNLPFYWSLLCKVYNVWPKKVQRRIFHDTEESCKIGRKTDLRSGKMTWGI